MKNCFFLLALSSVALSPFHLAAQTTPDPGKVVLTVGDQKITVGEFNDIVEALPQQYQAQARGSAKRQFAEQLVQLKLLAAEAEKQKVDQQEKVRNQVAFSRMSILAASMFEYMSKTLKIDDATIEKYYNDHRNEYEVVKAHHILVHVKGAPGAPPPAGKMELDDEQALAKAQEIRRLILAGGDFEKLAKEQSDDSNAAQGGDLGEFGKGVMVAPFEQAAFSLKPGEISEPVKSPFGYHLIRVDSRQIKSLADMRKAIEDKMRPELARQALEAMKKAANVKIDDDFFGPSPDATK